MVNAGTAGAASAGPGAVGDEHRIRQDLEDFFENGAVALHWVASDGSILRVNQAELEMLGYARDEYVGHHIADFHADKVVIDDILARLTRGERLDKFPARLKAKDGSIRHVLISSNVQFRDGKFVNTRCFTLDVTDLKKAQDALRESEERLRITQDHAFAGIGEVDLEGRFLRTNARFTQLTGYVAEELLALRFSDITHPEDRASEEEQFGNLAAGRIEGYRAAKRFLRKDGTVLWVELSASLVRDAQRRPMYGVRVVQDITELKQAEARQQFLLDELNHRVKNMLATVQSVAIQTRRSAPDLASFTKAFDGRLMALNRAHELLTREIGTGVLLTDLIRETVLPHGPGPDSAHMEGPPVRVRSELAITLAMAVHELVTNAVKYGALSVPSGRVDISWRIQASEAGPKMTLEWTEKGGPIVAAPGRRGFGSQLIERGLAGQLGGEAELMFEPGGLRCRITSPLPPSPEAGG